MVGSCANIALNDMHYCGIATTVKQENFEKENFMISYSNKHLIVLISSIVC